MNTGLLSISVIIPAYNAQDWIAEAVESVHKQNYNNLEIIVVDDGSTDSTARIVAESEHEITYRYESNQGPAAARNRGLSLASGRVVAFLDADDVWPKDSLAIQLSCLTSNSDLQVTQGLIQDMWPSVTQKDGVEFGPPRRGYNLGSALFRRSVFDKVGDFDETLRQSEDIEFWVRTNYHNINRCTIDEVTLFYRRRPYDSIDARRQHYSHVLRILKAHLDQSR